MNQMLVVIFCISIFAVVYTYVIYPVAIWLIARRVIPAKVSLQTDPPTVSLLIAAHNEEAVISQRIINALNLDYDRARLQILIVSDGSDDQTVPIVRSFRSAQVQLVERIDRSGKAAAVNRAIPDATGEIVVFSDANTMMAPDAIRKLVRWFDDETVGTVCGKLLLTDAETGKNVDGTYWRYENWIKRSEGKLRALLGANGAIYAMRRSDYRPIPSDTMIDDFVIPLKSRLETGKTIVFDHEAVAYEETSPGMVDEFRRRVRIGTGGAQALVRLIGLLHPRFGWTSLAFFSHKLLRWASPFLLLTALLANLMLLEQAVFRATAMLQVAFYGLALLSTFLSFGGRIGKLLRLPTMFVNVNAALFLGVIRGMVGGQQGTWQRTVRANINSTS